ncbi:unnamed protein product [Durusdinium trenchii]|uniref:Pumilio homolog 2 (Pumilio-2) n=2 Tax=Durusdinium trenchii TaxID=1381693 RepID=A0ABP0JVE6_9DINO
MHQADACEGELAGSILLDDDGGPGRDLPGLRHPLFDSALGAPDFFSPLAESRGRPAHQRLQISTDRTPIRTPSPVTPSPAYQLGGLKGFGDDRGFPASSASQRPPEGGGPSGAGGPGGPAGPSGWGASFSSFQRSAPPVWQGQTQAAPAYYNMVVGHPQTSSPSSVPKSEPRSVPGLPMDANVLSVMMALQNQGPGQNSFQSVPAPNPPPVSQTPPKPEREAKESLLSPSQALPPGPQPPRDRPEQKKGKSRKEKDENKSKQAPQPQQHEPGAIAPGSASLSRGSEKGGGKGDRRRRGGHVDVVDDRTSGKSRPQMSSPLIEHLKARERVVDLAELAAHISEIAQDQFGSRLIQQKLEVASEVQKQQAFKQVLQKMSQLTTDVFGNYVIQKFFEYGNAEQRRILAEQLVGQVLKLSLQMYGCRVVQKALDSVPIEQQVLLIGELKGHVFKCIEDQHGNHVIQKCIERLPTDRIGFIVDSFLGQAARMAKHCYGCRVIQRLIEYCASVQISALLDEVLHCCMELATDQYGNYVVQHVMEHSSRPGDRQHVMNIIRKNILSLSCHKYASNVIEKALQCATPDERALLVEAICGQPNDPHPPLLVMMRDRFGNYIVQRVIALAQLPQRDMLFAKLREHMPVLKKSNTYGKHIISAMERAQAGVKD